MGGLDEGDDPLDANAGTLSSSNEWNMICHEGVERGLRVAVYDFTPFHDGELALSVLASARRRAEVCLQR